jgi:hypothetical protein
VDFLEAVAEAAPRMVAAVVVAEEDRIAKNHSLSVRAF